MICDIRNAIADALREYERGLDLLAQWLADRSQDFSDWVALYVTIWLGSLACRVECPDRYDNSEPF